MKKLFLLIFLFCSFFKGFSQNTDYADRMEHIFGNIDKTKVTTGFLKEFGIRFNEVEAYNGMLNSSNWMDKTQWNSLYSSFYTMRVGNVAVSMASPATVFGNLENQQENSTEVLLAAQYYNYQQYKANAVTNGDVTVSNDRIYDVAGRNPYETKSIFAVMPLKQELRGSSFSFKLPGNLIYTNSGLSLSQVQIDFGNGQGYQTISLNTAKNVSYSSGGIKEIKVKFTYGGGPTLYSHAKIWIDYIGPIVKQARFNGTGATTTVVAGDPWQGSSATGYVTVELAPGHPQLTKPLIVVEGFDPDDSFDYFDLINENNPGGLLVNIGGTTLNQAIEGEGYDLVFVNFANGTDYIQRNAYMVEAVIDWVNAQKTAAGSTEKNVVLGMSMGGLVARYALRDMEINGETHDTKLYISHDAPHQGANVPLAFQALVRHLVGEEISLPMFFGLFDVNIMDLTEFVPDLEDGLDLLQTPAAQQMLIYQLQGTGSNVSVDNSTLHGSFATEYKNMGYPQQDNIRNIAIANGSECGTPLGFSPYATLMNVNKTTDLGYLLSNVVFDIINGLSNNPVHLILSSLTTNTDIKVELTARALPNQQSKQIYKGKIFIEKTILFFIDVEEPLIDQETLNSSASMLPLDNTGGGIYNLELFAELPSEMDSYVLERKFSFVPTYSSLDIGGGNQTINYVDLTKAYSPLSPPLAPKNTPFDNFYTNPTTSQNHIQFTLNNGNWLMDELRGNEAFYSCISSCSASSLPITISGTNQMCSNTPETYTLLHVNPDLNINWSVTPSGAVSNIVSNGNSVTVTSSGNFNSGATLQASISTNCGEKTIEKSIYMGIQRPHLLDINGDEVFHIEACTSIHYNFSFEIPPGTLEWEWRKISGNYSLINIGNNHATIFSYQPANGIFDVRIRDACGWGPRTMITVNVTNCQGGFEPLYTTYPNPVDNLLFIEKTINDDDQNSDATTQSTNLNTNGSGELLSSSTLYDFNGNPIATISPATGSINVESLPVGHYFLIVSYGNETESHHIIIN